MARARNIKPGFYQNDELAACSLPARFIFPGLWMLADREGRLEDRPLRIKAQLLPYENASLEKLLAELHNRGFIVRYEVSGCKYIQITNFRKHQNPHCKEPASTIPPPQGGPVVGVQEPEESGESTVQEPDSHSSGPADTGFPLTDSPSLIPDTPKPRTDSVGFGVPLPFQTPAFFAAWGLWETHRREKGVKLTETSVRQQFAKLAAMGEDRAVAAIEHSVANSYQGIYEPSTRAPHKRAGPKDRDAELMQQIRDALPPGDAP